MRLQTTPHILMVRPANFAFNAETAENNAFQSRDGIMSAEEMRTGALAEFDRFVALLREAHRRHEREELLLRQRIAVALVRHNQLAQR